MYIAYIVPSLANKGPEIVVKELVASFVRNGHQCIVFYFDDKIELTFDCPVKRISNQEVIDFSKYDIVHSHGIRPDRYIYKNKPKGKTKTLFASTLHNNLFIDLRYEYSRIVAGIFGRLWIKWLRRHDILITLSKDARNYYAKWFPTEQLAYAYNTRSPDFTQKLTAEEIQIINTFKGSSILIGVNSLLNRRKGIDLLIKALPFLNGYKLLIVGAGKSRNSLEKLARKLKVETQCLFVGYKPDACRYLAHYDLYAMPSRSEGFPLALLEAAAYVVPTVASNLPVMKEAFSSAEVSFFDLANPKSIIEAIITATENKTMAQKMNKKFIAAYSSESQYKQYLDIYQNSHSIRI